MLKVQALNPRLREMLASMLDPNLKDKSSPDVALNHPWFFEWSDRHYECLLSYLCLKSILWREKSGMGI